MRRWRRLFPLLASIAIAIATWTGPGALGPAISPCASPASASTPTCTAGALPAGMRSSAAPDRDRNGDSGSPPLAPDAGEPALPGGLGLPALVGGLGLLSALGAALAGSAASRPARNQRPAGAVAAASLAD